MPVIAPAWSERARDRRSAGSRRCVPSRLRCRCWRARTRDHRRSRGWTSTRSAPARRSATRRSATKLGRSRSDRTPTARATLRRPDIASDRIRAQVMPGRRDALEFAESRRSRLVSGPRTSAAASWPTVSLVFAARHANTRSSSRSRASDAASVRRALHGGWTCRATFACSCWPTWPWSWSRPSAAEAQRHERATDQDHRRAMILST